MEDLTDKQRVFVEEYLTCWNATEAAKRAGYPDASARQIGSENLSKPDIKALIDQRLKEKAMSADEVIARLADQARGSMGDFLKVNGTASFDFKKAQAEGKLHLIRSFTKGRRGTTLELYDAQNALIQLGKLHRLFADRMEITGKNGGPIETKNGPDLSNLSTEELRQWRELMLKAQGKGAE